MKATATDQSGLGSRFVHGQKGVPESKGMIRAVALLLTGMTIGVLIGLTVRPSSRLGTKARATQSGFETGQSSRQLTHRAPKAADDQGKLVLGNITTVPFQELYGILATKRANEIADVAKQLRDLPGGPDTNAKITTFFKAWSHLDAPAALKAALSFGAREAKSAAVNAVIEGADAVMASTLANAINELPPDALLPDQKQTFLSNALTKWGQNDPVAAAAFADSLSGVNDMRMGMAYNTIAYTWGRSDPHAALTWADAHNQGPGGQFVRNGAIRGWWEKDPRAAESYVAQRLNTLGGRQEALTIASYMFNSDPQRAKEWVAGLSDVEARKQGDIIIAIQIGWSDPKAAADWAASLPDDVRSEALGPAIGQWATNDPTAAARWLEGVSGAARDDAVSSYGYAISQRDPQAGLNWAMSMTDATKRYKAVESIVKDWMGRDPNSATAWIQSSVLPDATKQRLITSKPGG